MVFKKIIEKFLKGMWWVFEVMISMPRQQQQIEETRLKYYHLYPKF